MSLLGQSKFQIHKGTLLITLPQQLLGIGGSSYLVFCENINVMLWLMASYISWVLIGVVGVGTFYHKYWAHKSFNTYWFIELIGTFLGILAGLGAPFFWVAVHMDHHHRYADRNSLDLHSPTKGFFNAYCGWQFKAFNLKSKTAKRLLRCGNFRLFSKYYYQIYWTVVLLLFLIHPYAPIFLIFLPGAIHFHVEGLVASFCHTKRWGYRNYETDDESVNILLLGWLTWGAAFHNNHHGAPRKCHNRLEPYEIDLSEIVLFLIPKCRDSWSEKLKIKS